MSDTYFKHYQPSYNASSHDSDRISGHRSWHSNGYGEPEELEQAHLSACPDEFFKWFKAAVAATDDGSASDSIEPRIQFIELELIVDDMKFDIEREQALNVSFNANRTRVIASFTKPFADYPAAREVIRAWECKFMNKKHEHWDAIIYCMALGERIRFEGSGIFIKFPEAEAHELCSLLRCDLFKPSNDNLRCRDWVRDQAKD